MKISVIIPTYKPKGYLWECLDSLCAQTFPKEDFEVIIVLNGCRDPFEQELEAYMGNHPEVNWKYFQTDMGGVSNARNIALGMSTGEYVAFIDDDDYVSPSYLAGLYDVAGPGRVSLCYPYAFDDGEPGVQLRYEITEAYDRYAPYGTMAGSRVRKFFSGPCMKLIPSACIDGRQFDTRFRHGEDSLFMFLISDKIEQVSFTSPDAVYYRRFRENSAVTSSLKAGYVLDNCWKRIRAYSGIFFGHPFRYSFRRYAINILGTCHILVNYILKGQI